MSEIISDLQIIEKPDDFKSFTKIPRLRREAVVSEKIDGTLGGVYICHENSLHPGSAPRFWVSSKNRYIHPKGQDNFDFAKWCYDYKQELIDGLGEGKHWGEFCGPGIQKNIYNLKERQWFLFNTMRWSQSVPPLCCRVVPTIATGIFSDELIESAANKLKEHGSFISEGFAQAEGICIYHVDAKTYFKWTFNGDGHKGANK